MLFRFSIVILLTLTLAACGGGDASGDSDLSDAEARGAGSVEVITKGQAGRFYDNYLLPTQRSEIDRDLFVGCLQDSSTAEIEIDVDESYTEPADVPTMGEDVETVAITYTITNANDDSDTAVLTRHVVEQDGEYYVFYAQDNFDLLVDGTCP